MEEGVVMEITTAQIKDFATSDEIYQKGLALYEENAIVSLEIDDFSNEKIIFVNATLKDRKQYYEVNMSIDKDDVIVVAHLCNCPVHAQNIVSCEHCVAVLFRLQASEKLKASEAGSTTSYQDSAAIKLMNAYEEQLVYSSLAINLNNAIHVEPVFELRQKRIMAVTLKVGNEKRYIIKDVEQFLYDIEHNVKKSYGKELEFFHNIYSFDEESIPLIQFLQSHQHDTYYFRNKEMLKSAPQARNLCLTKDALDDFFLMYAGTDVMYRQKEKNLINVKFIDQNPSFTISNKIDEKGLYHVSLSHDEYRILEGRRHTYVLMDNILYRCDEEFTRKATPFLEAVLEKKDAFVLTRELMPGFYNNVLMNLRALMPLHGVDISEFAPLPLECKVYIDMPKLNVISARLMYVYGKDEYNAFSCDMLSTARNFNDEIAIRLVFTKYMTRIDAVEGIAYIERSQDAIYDFLNQGFEELNQLCDIYATDKFKKLEIRDSVNISMGVRIESDLLEINFDTFDFPVDELHEVLSSYRLHKKYYRMKNGSFVNLEESALQELSAVLDGMHVDEKDINSGVIKVPKYRSLYLDNSMKEIDMIKVDRDSSFKDIVRSIKNVEDADYPVPAQQKAILRNYQKVGFRWLKTMSEYGFGGILADDMGIGKTIQMITLLEDEKQHHPDSISLVVCPSSLILNWQSEIEKFSELLTSIIITGSSEERKVRIQNCRDYDIVITSYDYIKRDVEYYENIIFTYQILDEAQYIKNHNTKNASSVKAIQSIHRFALTGTPIENSLAELWSIFDYLMPGYLYSYAYFKKFYEYPIVKENDQVTLKELKRLVEPFILRRVKKDVLKELPAKMEHTMLVELDDEANKLYAANDAMMREDLKESFQSQGVNRSKIMVLSMLTRLRQLCCDPRLLYENFQGIGAKVTACMEYIESCKAAGKKVLLFSQFTSLLALLEKELVQADIPYYLLKGSTPKIARQQMVNSFNHDETSVFLISLKAGGTGLNLTSAEVVIHFDPWWNVSAQNQATDRAYRIGQHNNVQVIKLIAKDTIEEKIMQLQDLKKDLSDSIISNNEGIITQMSKEELLDLF